MTEPPLRGRPPGYATGDVGRFAVSADVTPRDVEQGGSIAVHIQVSGRGNLPTTIVPPARAGVEWLSPELHEELGPWQRALSVATATSTSSCEFSTLEAST